MNLIKGLFNAVANPQVFFSLAVVGLFVAVWQREKIASNLAGYGGLKSNTLGELWFRLRTIWSLARSCLVWVSLRLFLSATS